MYDRRGFNIKLTQERIDFVERMRSIKSVRSLLKISPLTPGYPDEEYMAPILCPSVQDDITRDRISEPFKESQNSFGFLARQRSKRYI